MGRRRHRWSDTCMLARKEERKNLRPTPTIVYVGMCGNQKTNDISVTTSESNVTCAACKSKLAEKAVKASTELEFGEAIKDEAWLKFSYRSIWPLRYQGKLLGFAVLENGWGKPWMIREVAEDGSMGEALGYRYSSKDQYNSRFDALLAVPRLHAEGKLYTQEDAEAAVAKRRAADQAEREERQRKKAEQDREREEMREALVSIANLPLSNIQRAALEKAYRATFFTTLPMPKVEA
jgi:hypothetical protein